MTWRTKLALSLGVLLASCSSGPKECKPDDATTCSTDQVCEAVQNATPAFQCFAPVILRGKVYDLGTSGGISGATVLATDENGGPAGAAVKTGSDGTYELRVPSARTDATTGAFVARKVMLRSQAKNYVPFPSGTRISLPIDTSAAKTEKDGGPYVLKTTQTDVGLSPVDASLQNLPSVSGTIELSADQKSVLLALESTSNTVHTTLSAPDGTFSFFNVPAGTWKLSAYCKGFNYTALDVTVASTDITGLQVKKSTVTTASLTGKISLVAGAVQGTSVVLALESTFIESLGRGEMAPGLRAPEQGTAPNLGAGGWTISGIPDGKYVVLAAFENDGDVRDPDPGISGTQIQHITVSNGAITAGSTSPDFKVTAAVELVSPGKDGPEGVTATPTFTWTTYSNADSYLLTVYDALGREISEQAHPRQGDRLHRLRDRWAHRRRSAPDGPVLPVAGHRQPQAAAHEHDRGFARRVLREVAARRAVEKTLKQRAAETKSPSPRSRRGPGLYREYFLYWNKCSDSPGNCQGLLTSEESASRQPKWHLPTQSGALDPASAIAASISSFHDRPSAKLLPAGLASPHGQRIRPSGSTVRFAIGTHWKSSKAWMAR
ncbi:MAG: carboxypeptidase-like regulatory domain-containing protein [Myxococcales bacterium]